MDVTTLTLLHTALSFIALTFGIVAVRGFFEPTSPLWTKWFLLTAVITTASGFMFPFNGMTPAVGTGIVTSAIFVLMFIACYRFKSSVFWRVVYISGLVAQLYFMVFVAIAQAFLKLPPLQAIAPTGTELPFVIAQLICLLVFARIGFKAVKKYKIPEKP